MTARLYQTLEQQMNAAPQQQAPQSFQGQPNGNGQQVPDPALAYQDPAEYQRQLLAYQQQLVNASLAQVAQPVLQQTAALAKRASQSGPHAEVWKKYGPEIDALVASVPAGQRTVEVYDQAARMVKADHADDYVNELVERRLSQHGAPATERTGGEAAPMGGGGDALDVFFDSGHAYLEQLRDAGVTKQMLRGEIARKRLTPEQWVDQVKRANFVRDGRGGIKATVMGGAA